VRNPFGADKGWDRRSCFCNDQFDVKDCSVQGIYKTQDVLEKDPESLACPRLIPGWSTDLRSMQFLNTIMINKLVVALLSSTDKLT
jgi:hypothetical protein